MVFLTPLCICFPTCFSMFYRVNLVLSEPFQVWIWLKSWGKSVKKGARIGVFPCGTIERSSLTIDPTRSRQTIFPDIYGSFHIFQRFALITYFLLWSRWRLHIKSHPYLYFVDYASFARDLDLFLDNCYCKGDSSSSRQRRSSWTLLIYLWIYMQYYSIIMSGSSCVMAE